MSNVLDPVCVKGIFLQLWILVGFFWMNNRKLSIEYMLAQCLQRDYNVIEVDKRELQFEGKHVSIIIH